MIKLLIFFGFLFGIFYFFYYKIKNFIIEILTPPTSEEKKETPKSINKGEMVKCPVCGTYFPEDTGIKKNGKVFCSNECMLKEGK